MCTWTGYNAPEINPVDGPSRQGRNIDKDLLFAVAGRAMREAGEKCLRKCIVLQLSNHIFKEHHCSVKSSVFHCNLAQIHTCHFTDYTYLLV